MNPSESTHCGRFFLPRADAEKLFGVLLFFSALLLHAGSCHPCSAPFPRSSVCRRVMTAGGAAPCRAPARIPHMGRVWLLISPAFTLPRPGAHPPRHSRLLWMILVTCSLLRIPLSAKNRGQPSPAPQPHLKTAIVTAVPIPPVFRKFVRRFPSAGASPPALRPLSSRPFLKNPFRRAFFRQETAVRCIIKASLRKALLRSIRDVPHQRRKGLFVPLP